MANAGTLLKLVPSLVDVSLSEIETKLTQIEGEILASILRDKTLADGKTIWEGDGAVQFSTEIQNIVQPDIEDLLLSMREMIQLIQKASTDVQSTDQTLAGQVSGTLEAEFAAIYR